MNSTIDLKISRRNFLKLSGATALAAAGGAGNLLGTREAKAVVRPMDFESKYGVCDMCFNKCSLIARVQGRGGGKTGPQPQIFTSPGACSAPGATPGSASSTIPTGSNTPCCSKGATGEGKWQRLTWEQALDHAAEKLSRIAEKYTRCGVMFMAGADMQVALFVHRFAEAFGSYNALLPRVHVPHRRHPGVFWTPLAKCPSRTCSYTKYVVMCGANRFEALVTPGQHGPDDRHERRGAKLVVMDPRYTKTAALAHEYHAIKPHTDMALMLAFAMS